MDLLHPRCAGLDVSKRDAKVCVRVASGTRAAARSTVTTWGSVTNQVLALREHLIAEQVTLVVMEATGDYWKPFYYLLEDAPFEVMLVNARHVKNLPGRKTDVSDAAWLAQLGAHGLVRGSFVPPEPIRQLRDLTRTRTTMCARTHAAHSGWLPPWAWDDSGQDNEDPAKDSDQGHGLESCLDEIAIEQAIQGESVRLTRAERDEAIVCLTNHDVSARHIAALIGTSSRNVVRRRAASRAE